MIGDLVCLKCRNTFDGDPSAYRFCNSCYKALNAAGADLEEEERTLEAREKEREELAGLRRGTLWLSDGGSVTVTILGETPSMYTIRHEENFKHPRNGGPVLKGSTGRVRKTSVTLKK